MERRPRQHESIDQRYRDANVDALVERTQHPASGRSVNVDPVAYAGVPGRNDVRLSVEDKSDVADKTLVEDRVDLSFVVDAPLREPPDLGPVSGCECVHVSPAISAARVRISPVKSWLKRCTCPKTSCRLVRSS